MRLSTYIFNSSNHCWKVWNVLGRWWIWACLLKATRTTYVHRLPRLNFLHCHFLRSRPTSWPDWICTYVMYVHTTRLFELIEIIAALCPSPLIIIVAGIMCIQKFISFCSNKDYITQRTSGECVPLRQFHSCLMCVALPLMLVLNNQGRIY